MEKFFTRKQDGVAENRRNSFSRRSPLVEKAKRLSLAAVATLALSLPATLSSCAPRYSSTYQSTSTTTTTRPTLKVLEKVKFGEYTVIFYRTGISPKVYSTIVGVSDGAFMYNSEVGIARRGNLVYVAVKKDKYWDLGEYNVVTHVNKGVAISPPTGKLVGERSKGWLYAVLNRSKGVLLDTKEGRVVFVDLEKGKQYSFDFLNSPW